MHSNWWTLIYSFFTDRSRVWKDSGAKQQYSGYFFFQICDQIITMAKEEKASKNNCEMRQSLDLLEDAFQESSENRQGKTFYHNSA